MTQVYENPREKYYHRGMKDIKGRRNVFPSRPCNLASASAYFSSLFFRQGSPTHRSTPRFSLDGAIAVEGTTSHLGCVSHQDYRGWKKDWTPRYRGKWGGENERKKKGGTRARIREPLPPWTRSKRAKCVYLSPFFFSLHARCMSRA